MTHELQETFREILNETLWLDIETKVCVFVWCILKIYIWISFLFFETKLKAESKVSRMSLKIGYPDYILNTDELNQKYKDLEIHPDRYFENILNVLRYLTRSEQSKFRFEMIKSIFFHHFH